MKRIMVVDEAQMRLLSDPLNQQIIMELVKSELSVQRLSRRLGEPHLKVWRRIQRLRAADLIEETGSLKVRNLEEKMYRAKAARYVPRGLLEFEPSEPAIREAYTLYREINSKMLSVLLALQDVPAGVDPLDFCVAADMFAFAQVLSQQETHRKLTQILALLRQSSIGELLAQNAP